MRLRTVSSIILPSAHKVKASARNSVTTVVGGGEMLRGTLERVPRTPQNFSQILYWRGWGGGAERGLAPGGGCAPARHLFALPLWCPVGACPARHLLSLPRGRGPSQTPKFLSPGPPSPWLPALFTVDKQKPLVVQVPPLAQARGCKGRSPLHKKTKNLPLPHGGRGSGGWGQKCTDAAENSQCRPGSAPGMQGAEPPAK